MKKLIALILIACMLFALAACAASDQTADGADDSQSTQNDAESGNNAETEELSGKLVFWTVWNESESQGMVFQEICDEFMELHPDVEIEIQYCGRDLGTLLKPALDAGEEIDVFDFPLNTKIEEYALDLTEFVEMEFPTTNGEKLKDTLMPSLMELPKTQIVESNGQLLALGYSPWMASFMYNADIFEELGLSEPKTWEELDAVCAKIKEAGISPLTFDAAYAFLIPGMFI